MEEATLLHTFNLGTLLRMEAALLSQWCLWWLLTCPNKLVLSRLSNKCTWKWVWCWIPSFKNVEKILDCDGRVTMNTEQFSKNYELLSSRHSPWKTRHLKTLESLVIIIFWAYCQHIFVCAKVETFKTNTSAKHHILRIHSPNFFSNPFNST